MTLSNIAVESMIFLITLIDWLSKQTHVICVKKNVYPMMYRLAACLANKTIHIEPWDNDYEVYLYFYEVMLGQTITFILLLLIGIAIKSVPQMLVYVVFLVLLQKLTSGYHAKTHIGCNISPCTISAIAVMISRIISPKGVIFVFPLLLMAVIYIRLNAPINHINLELSSYEMVQLKKGWNEFYCWK